MIIGLIDADLRHRKKCTFPNLALMKLSAWHKAHGDMVEWYEPCMGQYNRVYVSKVFSDEYTPDVTEPIFADEIIRGGSGYAITVGADGKEHYDKSKDSDLPEEIDRIMPDYGLYEEHGITDTAYGFLTKGCPRGCDFCHVKCMQGRMTYTVARLSEFWNGQKTIKLLDPNLTASRDWKMHLEDLIASRAYVDFTQGLDARLLTSEKIRDLNRVRWKMIHFAWDKPDEDLRPHFQRIHDELKGCRKQKVSAYVLTNFGSTHEQDLMRIQFLRGCNIQPYVMIYRKDTAPTETRQLQRWCNPFIFWKVPTFDEYRSGVRNEKEKANGNL